MGLSGSLRKFTLEGSNAKKISAAYRSSQKTGRNVGVFGAGDSPKVNSKVPNPEKTGVRNRTRRLSLNTCESVQNCDLRRDEETEKKILLNFQSALVRLLLCLYGVSFLLIYHSLLN